MSLPFVSRMARVALVLALLAFTSAMSRSSREGDRARLLVAELLPPEATSVARVIQVGGDRAFRYLFSVDVQVFTELVLGFDVRRPRGAATRDFRRTHAHVGRPLKLNNWMLVGLTLVYLTTPTPIKLLQLMFGVGDTVLRESIVLGLDMLALVLDGIPDAAVSWPSFDQQAAWNAMIRTRFSAMYPTDGAHKPFAFVDGTHFRVPAPGAVNKSNRFYSAYKKFHTINNIIAFAPNGTIIYALCNLPGASSDVSCARRLQRIMGDTKRTLPKYRLLADTGFVGRSCFVTTRAKHSWPNMTAGDIAWHNFASIIRQCNEWGYAKLKTVFGRLRALPASSVTRQRILSVTMRVFNLATRRSVGRNEIQTVYAHCVARRLQVLATGSTTLREMLDEAVHAYNAAQYAAGGIPDDDDLAVDVAGLPDIVRSEHEAIVHVMMHEQYSQLVTDLINDATAFQAETDAEMDGRARAKVYKHLRVDDFEWGIGAADELEAHAEAGAPGHV